MNKAWNYKISSCIVRFFLCVIRCSHFFYCYYYDWVRRERERERVPGAILLSALLSYNSHIFVFSSYSFFYSGVRTAFTGVYKNCCFHYCIASSTFVWPTRGSIFNTRRRRRGVNWQHTSYIWQTANFRVKYFSSFFFFSRFKLILTYYGFLSASYSVRAERMASQQSHWHLIEKYPKVMHVWIKSRKLWTDFSVLFAI